MNQRPLAHTSLPNTATDDKLPNPPIPSRFYYTPWACKEQLWGEKGGSEKTVDVKRGKKTYWQRYNDSGKICRPNKGRNKQPWIFSIKRTCPAFLMLKRRHSEALSNVFLDNYVWQNPSRERSADRCQFLQVYHFRRAKNILRMGQSESLFLM